jgi:very-short-patch-repair endonuclease
MVAHLYMVEFFGFETPKLQKTRRNNYNMKSSHWTFACERNLRTFHFIANDDID